MSDFTKNARVTVYINGQNAATELDKLTNKVQDIKKKLSAAGKDTPLGKELQKQLRETTAELDRMRDKAGLTGMSIRQLETEAKKLKNLRNSVAPGTEAFKDLDGRLKQVKERIEQVSSGLGPMGQAWKKVSFEAKAAAGIFAGNLIVSEIGGMVASLGKMDDQLADVKKSANLSSKDLAILNEELGKIKTRSSRTELRDLAYEAGKLGKSSVEDILAFVKAADQIKIALGRDLGTDAITEIGKLSSLFKLEELYGTEKGMLMIASAINEVGAASTASEGYIVDFLKRTSGVASIAKVTAPELIGLAGTLDSLGQTSEVSSTAISKLLTKMGADVDTYAKLAGKSVDEFRNTMNQSGLEALLQVFENVGNSQSGLEQLTATLGDLGVDGGRIVGVFGTLAQNIDEVRRQTAIANKEYQSATSITKEVEIRSQSLGAILDGLKKDFIGIWQNNEIKEGVRSIVTGLASLVRVIKENATFIGMLAKNIVTATVIWGLYKLSILAANFQLKEGTILARAYALVQEVMAGKITLAAGAMRSFNAVIRANPFGAILTAIIAFDQALSALSRNTTQQLMLEKERRDTLSRLNKLTIELEASQRAMNNTLQNFNLLTKQERENAAALADTQLKRLTLQLEELKLRRNSVAALANEATVRQKLGNIVSAGGNMIEAANLNIKDGITNSKEATQLLDEQIKSLTSSVEELGKGKAQMDDINNAEKIGDGILGKTIEQLNEKIRRYQQALSMATTGTDEFIRITQKLKKAQDELSKVQKSTEFGDDKNKSAKKAADELIKIEEDKFKHALDSLKNYYQAGDAIWKEIENSRTKTDSDLIAAEEKKWQDLIGINRRAQDELRTIIASKNATPQSREFSKAKLGELLFQEMALMDQRTEAVSDKEMELAHKRLAIIKKLNEEISDLSKSEQENEIKNVEQKYDKLASIAADAKDIELVTQIEELKEQAKAEVREKYRKLEEQTEQEAWQKKIETTYQLAQTLSHVFDKVGEIVSARDQKDLDKDRLNNEQKKKNLDRQLKLKLISQDQYNSKVEALDTELAKKQLEIRIKEAKRQKLFSAFQIGIDTSASIMAMLKTGPSGIPLSIAAGITGAANLAAVLATPLPQFGKGTIFDGMRHSSNPSMDGNPVIDRRTGLPIATVEAGELLLSRSFVENNPELTRVALRSSQQENGRRITAEEIYGRPSRIDTAGFRNALAVTRYRRGELFSDYPNGKSASAGANDGLMRMMLDRFDTLIEETRKPNRSYVVRKDLTDMDNEDSFFKKYTEIK